MADKKISEMTAMVSSDIANNDSIVIADVSENHTKRAEISELTTFFGISPEGQRDTVGQLFTTGTHSGVTVTYDDPNDKINIVLNGNVTDAELGHLNGVTSDIQTQFGTKANLASPTFTGTVSAPSPSADDNSTKIATTGYVQGELTAYASDTATFTNKSGANSQWTNDSGYITPSSTSTLTNKSGSISQWTNNSGYITPTSTETLNNKTISGSNNTISNVPYSAISGFVDEDISSVSGSHDTVASAKATKTYVDAQITGINELSEATDSDITNPSAGQILVHDGSDSFDNETVSITLSGDVTGTANMDSSGDVSITTNIPNDSVTINGQAVALGGSATIPSLLNSGGTFIGEVHLNDNVPLTFGGALGSADLSIYHNATDNYIYSNNKTLRVQGNGSPIKISPVNAELSAEFKANAEVDLYYNNVKKISTSSVGGNINGDLTVTGTVDGRDVATDGTKLDGIASGAEVNVQADYNATSGDAQILNKPSLATVATSGSYADLSNKPTIPTNNNQLSNGSGYITSFTNTTYSAGTGLSLSGTTFNNTITNNNQLSNGAGYVTTNTTYSAGTGLSLSGTTFNNTITNNNQLSNGAGYTTNTGTLTQVTSGGATTVSAGNGIGLNNGSGTITMSGSYSGSFSSTGNITAYSSDERLKNFKGKIENALDKVERLSGYYYEWNDTAKNIDAEAFKEGLEVGVNAQEVEAIMPEVIATAPIVEIHNLDTDYKTVHYDKLVPLLIEAIKELKNKIEELKTKKECECKKK
jgi:hypothetical protein